MTNILKVTTPVSGYGKITPERVQGDQNTTKAASQKLEGNQSSIAKFRYESNYGSFIKQLQENLFQTGDFSKIFSEGLGGNEYLHKLQEFRTELVVNPEDIPEVFKTWHNASAKFSGDFFGVFREVLNSNAPLELKAEILEFIRRYSDLSDTPRMLESIRHTLTEIEGHMYQEARNQLKELTANLTLEGTNEEIQAELGYIREKVLPFLNLYISRTNERGRMRDLSALLGNLLGRCENGAPSRVEEGFANLMKYQTMNAYFPDLDSSGILQFLANTDYEKAKRGQKWVKKFQELVTEAMAGKAGKEQQILLKNMVHSTLLNESVYMPVLHSILPMQVNENLTFVEMWVDPDADKRTSQDETKQGTQSLIKFDIENVGKFDLFFYHQEGKVRMQLNAPEAFKETLGQIKTDIGKIIRNNDLEVEELFVETGKEMIPLTEAFPRIVEKENVVNVRI
ncbi:hypothetical protein M2454_000896 [Aequitasia blattaphilus]|uniref:Uncharacterized protein n=1 Tax=Aequitasia blattaphilus TaxID=2949332 RepID=A0ABT1E9J3_9FIRM|nr:hypothetical protein [Aequitasia blattaphilus]MCP1102495.1 hypothetical protein [Aequitasia blattaphilus]MCR8615135.1 hypothetical protein [Aequitasia blattaphilus]